MDFKSKYLKYKNKYLQLKNTQLGGNPYILVTRYDEDFFLRCKYAKYKNNNNFYIKEINNNEYIPVVFEGCLDGGSDSIPDHVINYNIFRRVTSYVFKKMDNNKMDNNKINIIVHNNVPLGNIQVFIGPINEISKKYILNDPKRKEEDRLEKERQRLAELEQEEEMKNDKKNDKNGYKIDFGDL